MGIREVALPIVNAQEEHTTEDIAQSIWSENLVAHDVVVLPRLIEVDIQNIAHGPSCIGRGHSAYNFSHGRYIESIDLGGWQCLGNLDSGNACTTANVDGLRQSCQGVERGQAGTAADHLDDGGGLSIESLLLDNAAIIQHKLWTSMTILDGDLLVRKHIS